jgi:tetratricopeptide (TPR) repeat protein
MMSYSTPRRLRLWNNVARPVLFAGVAVMELACGRAAPAPHDSRTNAAPVPALSDAEVRDQDIVFYAARVERDPTGGMDLARLGALYLERSRETGDWRDATRAEEAARRSLRNRAAHNDAAAQVLASALLSQHKFDDALGVARDLRDRNPTSAPIRAQLAEVQMELGMYDSARVAFDSLAGDRTSLAVVPRLARWAEIEGRSDDARRLMRHALAIARRDPRTPREQLAWFWLRVGDIELRAGRFRGADSAYRSGLAAHPNDYRVLTALARLAANERRWDDAIGFANDAVAQVLDPATLGILSEAYAATGDAVRSREYAHALDVAVRGQPGDYHRAWSLFLLDHGRPTAALHRRIRDELKTRRDVYGYDLYAWSLYKQRRYADARGAMSLALGQGTQDAQLFFHAGKIALALGDSTAAEQQLARARTLNPSLQ